MCSSKPPKPVPPAPAPPPPPEALKAPEMGTEQADRSLISANRKGRSSFRIDPIGASSSGSGLNIPVA